MLIAIVSPNALPNPSKIAEKIPGAEALKTTFFIVSHFVAPTDNDASFIAIGTASNDSTQRDMIIGKTITERVIEAVKIQNPVLSIPKNGAMKSLTSGMRNKNAHKPYTTEGTPANTSINGRRRRRIFLGEYSLMYTALRRDIGMAMTNAITVTSIVPIRIDPNPNSPLVGFHTGDKRRSMSELLERTNEDFVISVNNIRKNTKQSNPMTTRIELMPIVSRIFRIFIRYFLPKKGSFTPISFKRPRVVYLFQDRLFAVVLIHLKVEYIHYRE